MLFLIRWLFRLAIVFVILVLIAVGVDYGARIETQDQIASAVKRSSGAGSVSAKISSFPYLFHLADEGKIDHVTIDARQVPAGTVTLTDVQVAADSVVINRSDLLKGKEQLKSVSRATVTVQYQLTGAVAALASGADISASATSSRNIEFSVGGRVVFTIDLSSIPLIPDCSFQESHQASLYTFSCTVSPVPASILNSLSR